MAEDNENTASKYYANIMLGLIAFMMAYTINTQSTIKEEQIRQKTIQEIDLAAMKELTTRVIALERDNTKGLQEWVEKNYVRKSQE